VNVYKTQFKYVEINDHFTETFIGRIEQNAAILGRSLDVHVAQGGQLKTKYRIQGTFGAMLKDCLLPKLWTGPTKQTKYRILDLITQEEIKHNKLLQFRIEKSRSYADSIQRKGTA